MDRRSSFNVIYASENGVTANVQQILKYSNSPDEVTRFILDPLTRIDLDEDVGHTVQFEIRVSIFMHLFHRMVLIEISIISGQLLIVDILTEFQSGM